jgi:hypothetical protein
MKIPEQFQDKSEKDIVLEIEKGLITQQGVQTMQDSIADAWAETALKEGYICIRRLEGYTELYKTKKR